MTTTIRQRHGVSFNAVPSSRWILLVAILIVSTTTKCTNAYTIHAPKNTRPFQTTRLMSEHTKKESSHEETYALRRPPKKRSSASKVRMTSSLVDHHATASLPTFERRMRNVLLRDEQKKKRLNTTRGPPNVKMVTSIEDYKKVVGEEREKIVVARFYAPWCKACRAIQPMYYRLANKFTNVVFVEVPVNEENAALHQGLQVPSLPYSHIYEPSTGLVEELKISRQHISDFANKLQSYVVGSCKLENKSTASPYHSDDQE